MPKVAQEKDQTKLTPVMVKGKEVAEEIVKNILQHKVSNTQKKEMQYLEDKEKENNKIEELENKEASKESNKIYKNKDNRKRIENVNKTREIASESVEIMQLMENSYTALEEATYEKDLVTEVKEIKGRRKQR